MPSRKHEVIEHHYQVEGGKTWEVKVGEVTNRWKETERLAALRDAGKIPPTLSHWTIGGKRVMAQYALELFERQVTKKEQA